jgi:hypothetical protein
MHHHLHCFSFPPTATSLGAVRVTPLMDEQPLLSSGSAIPQ